MGWKGKRRLLHAVRGTVKWKNMIILNETGMGKRHCFCYFLYCILSISVLKYILAYNVKCRLVKELSSQECCSFNSMLRICLMWAALIEERNIYD